MPEYFPTIFGPDENLPLDKEITLGKFRELTEQINNFVRNSGGNEVNNYYFYINRHVFF